MRELKKKVLEPNQIKEKLKQLIQQTLQEALEAELEEFLGYSKYERSEKDNYKICAVEEKKTGSKRFKTDISRSRFIVFLSASFLFFRLFKHFPTQLLTNLNNFFKMHCVIRRA